MRLGRKKIHQCRDAEVEAIKFALYVLVDEALTIRSGLLFYLFVNFYQLIPN